MKVKSKSEVMVAVCTRNRSEMLRRCIMSLQACCPPEQATAVIYVVDNSDMLSFREQNRETLDSLSGMYELRFIDAPEPGLSNVRNCALNEADKQAFRALIFVDDDQTVSPDWLGTMVQVWLEEKCEAVKSCVRFEFEGEGRYREFFKESGGDEKALLPRRWPLKYTATNGVLISNKLFSQKRLRFNTHFNLTGGEDFDFFLQSSAIGGRHMATSECWITEFIPVAKQSRLWLMRRQFQVGYGQTCVVGRHEGKSRLHCISSGILRLLCHAPFTLLFALMPRRALHHVLSIAYGTGQIWGALGLSWRGYTHVVGR